MAHGSVIWVAIVYSCLLNNCDDVSAVHKNSITLSSTYHIMDKKPLSVVNDRFLSYTFQPRELIGVSDCGEANYTLNLIRTLLPAYLRIAGPDSRRLLFHDQQPNEATNVTSGDAKNRKILVTGPQWLKFIDFVRNTTGLQLIVSLNGNFERDHSDLDLTNALEFITFSSKHNLDLDWELGYEFQKMSDHDGEILGRDVAKLRKVLDVFPRYRKSLILGPGMTSLETRADVAFVQTYLSEADDSLNAFTLHHDFSTLKEDDDVFEKLAPIFNRMDTYLWIKEGVLKTLAKGVVEKKSIWLSETDTKGVYSTFAQTLSFVQRLGAAAKLGVSVYLRKPNLMSLSTATSEYWAATLFKSLVGKTVLDAKYVDGNNTKVFTFGHCTRVFSNADDNIINPNVAYKPGAITLYGVNAGSEWSRLFFKLNSRYEQVVHQYILTEEKGRYDMEKTMFNRQELRLSGDQELPIVFPRIREYAKYAVLPPRSIFFLVLPYANSRVCMTSASNADDESHDAANKKLSSTDNDEAETDLVGILEEDEPDDSAIYVSYPSKKQAENSTPLSSPKLESSKNTKFITYSEDTWLSPLPNQLREIFYKNPTNLEDDIPHSKKEKRLTKRDKYQIITQALLGKRNVSINASQEPISRFSRSMDTYTDDKEAAEEAEKDNVHEMVTVEEGMFDVDRDMVIENTNDEQQSDLVGTLVHRREPRDADSNYASFGTTALPPPSDEENLSDLESADRLINSEEDTDEYVRLGREISADAADTLTTIDNNLHSTRSQHIIPLPRRTRKSKLSDEIVMSALIKHKTTAAAPITSSNSSPSDANPTPASILVTTESTTSTPLASDLHQSEASESGILASEMSELISKMTTMLVTETTQTPNTDVPSGARSVDEELNTAKHHDKENERKLEVKFRRKPKKISIIDPVKRKPGYMSTTTHATSTSKLIRRSRLTKPTTVSPSPAPVSSTTKRSRIAKPTTPSSTTSPVSTTTKRSRISRTTTKLPRYVTRKLYVRPHYDHPVQQSAGNADDALPKVVEETHAKLKQIVEDSHAKIQMLKDERMLRKSLHSDLQPSRRKREVAQNVRKVRALPLSHYIHSNQLQSSSESSQLIEAKDLYKHLSINAKDLYSDVSEKMRDRIRSLTGWIREKYDEINRELATTRSKHDLVEIRKQIRDYSAKIQKELTDMRERLRLRPAKNVSRRKPAQQHVEVESANVNILEGGLPLHRYHQDETVAVMGKNADAYEVHGLTTSVIPILIQSVRSNGTSDLFLNSRSVRSVESNEILSKNNDVNSVTSADDDDRNNTSSLDHFEANMVDMKLRKATSLFSKVKPIKTVDDDLHDGVAKKFHHQNLKWDDASELHSEIPSNENLVADDDEMCERNASFAAYLWCKCKNFLIVIISLFNNNNRNN